MTPQQTTSLNIYLLILQIKNYFPTGTTCVGVARVAAAPRARPVKPLHKIIINTKNTKKSLLAAHHNYFYRLSRRG